MLAADLAYMIADLPATITIDGASYSVAASDPAQAGRMEIEGVAFEYDIFFVLTRSQFTTLPKPNTRLIYADREYIVARVMDSADAVSLTLYCMGVNG